MSVNLFERRDQHSKKLDREGYVGERPVTWNELMPGHLEIQDPDRSSGTDNDGYLEATRWTTEALTTWN